MTYRQCLPDIFRLILIKSKTKNIGWLSSRKKDSVRIMKFVSKTRNKFLGPFLFFDDLAFWLEIWFCVEKHSFFRNSSSNWPFEICILCLSVEFERLFDKVSCRDGFWSLRIVQAINLRGSDHWRLQNILLISDYPHFRKI